MIGFTAIIRPRIQPNATWFHVFIDLSLMVDGRRVLVPLAWFPTLLGATPEQRSHLELIGDGEGIHWPDIDADISVSGLLFGLRESAATGC